MKKRTYQIFVYVTLLFTLVSLFFFVFCMKTNDGFSGLAIMCLVFFILGIVLFVLNQVIYRRWKKGDASRYEEVECPHCHTMNPKKEIFCKKCGKNLY